MKNLKDTITTICGIVLAASGAIYTLHTSGVVLPQAVITGFTVAGAVATAVMAFYIGKNPDGSTKSDEQIVVQNQQSKTIDPSKVDGPTK